MSTKPYHDRFARYNLSDPDLARSFLREFVTDPRLAQTDLDQLRNARDAKIERDLGELITDLLYQAPYRHHTAYVSVLIEHKSQGALRKTENSLPFLLRKQEMAVMEEARRIHERNKMPSVIMVGLYHGEEPYAGPTTVAEEIDAPAEMIPSHWKEDGSVIVDMCRYSDEFLAGLEGRLGVFLQMLKHIYDDDIIETVKRLLPKLQSLESHHQDFIISVFTYLYGASRLQNKEELDELAIQSFTEETGGEIMTIAEQLELKGEKRGLKIGEQKGLKIGEKRGEQRGEVNAKKEFALRLLADGVALEKIAVWTGFTVKEVQALNSKRDL